ncbi:amino acid adenylation domain-containing protein [Amycolatopsis keratiniphila]|uniref:amino acid adenylation domain-containing protein n=1 Tax=Amycolatopsis keratiniphila TaxID=129921 RepID=UPI000F4F3B55|nr:amino acid adenylation domain-containing protein [Amycolatopsis keratiniphila]
MAKGEIAGSAGISEGRDAILTSTIVSRFERQVSTFPGHTALTSDGSRLTYAQLHERSSNLAQAIFEAGVRRGDRVGVSLRRGPELVIALLAVMKTGAAYVPLDPEYPLERTRFIAEDSKIKVMVTQSGTSGFAGVRAIDMGSRLSMNEPTFEGPAPEDVAYIIYTSGSTGKPKGVLVPHRSVVALFEAVERNFGFSDDDVWTLFHSFAFDFSVWEMWGCLSTGGRLVVVPYWTTRDPAEFHALLVRERVTVLSQTPSAFTQLIAAPAFPGGGLSVRLLVFGGEALDVRALRSWFARYPEVRVENMYGITETTVHVTTRTLTSVDVESGTRSVGVPLPGWTVRLLGPDGKRVPVGEPGEIYVGGAGVTLGYLDRPELNEQRFLPDPDGNGTIYRSGDLARELPGGEIEYLGRLDDQVKVRGHRIELGEIRAALTENPAVRAAVVVGNGSRGLDAYVVTSESYGMAKLRRHLSERLPAYLVPDTITVIPELPLTVNGKVDISRLPAPGKKFPIESSAGLPAEPISIQVAAIWEEILGVPVAADDNFFEVGGNSLAAARLAVELARSGLADITMRELYLHASLKTMTELVRSKQKDD